MKQRIYKLLEPAEKGDILSHIFDALLIGLIVLNTLIVIFDNNHVPPAVYRSFGVLSNFSIAVFTVEYLMRFWTADLKYPEITKSAARKKFVLSLFGILDLLVLFAFYLPFIDFIDLRVLRTARIFQLLRALKITRYTEAPIQVGKVLKKRMPQLLSAMTITFLLIVISSVLIFSIENRVQPDKYDSIFSAFYWSVMTIATVGYGDISPITTIGRILSSLIVLLGMGLIALPAGIISAGFMQEIDDTAKDENGIIRYCPYCGKEISVLLSFLDLTAEQKDKLKKIDLHGESGLKSLD